MPTTGQTSSVAINPLSGSSPAGAVVTLDLSIAQAEAIAGGLDFFVRLSLGQFDEIASKFAFGEFKIAQPDANSGRLPSEEECCNLRSICASLKRVAGHVHGSSFGIGSRAVSDNAHASYEVMKVLKQSLALHRDPVPRFKGVDYDGLTVRYTREPRPVCTVSPDPINRAAQRQVIEEAQCP